MRALPALLAAVASAGAHAQLQPIPVEGGPLSYVYHLAEVHETSTYQDDVRVLLLGHPTEPKLSTVLEVVSSFRPPRLGKGGVVWSWNLGGLFDRVENVTLVNETVTIVGHDHELVAQICTYVFHFEEGLLAKELEDKGCVPHEIPSLTGADEIEIAELLATVRTHGAPHVARSLLRDNYPAWAAMLRGVQAGNPDYLSLAESLRPDAEPLAAEQLDDALFMALARNPLQALRLLDDPRTADRFYVQTVCNPDLAGNRELADNDWKPLLEERIAVLQDFGDEGTDAARRACIRNLYRVLNSLQ